MVGFRFFPSEESEDRAYPRQSPDVPYFCPAVRQQTPFTLRRCGSVPGSSSCVGRVNTFLSKVKQFWNSSHTAMCFLCLDWVAIQLLVGALIVNMLFFSAFWGGSRSTNSQDRFALCSSFLLYSRTPGPIYRCSEASFQQKHVTNCNPAKRNRLYPESFPQRPIYIISNDSHS